MRRPFNGQVVITTEYGEVQPGSRRGYHTGVDYGLNQGTAILAPENGTIAQNGDGRAASDGRGFFVTIVGDSGVGHCLYHLKQMGNVSGRVSEGEVVGYSGNTGASTGPHLHWETRHDVNNNTSDFPPGTWLFANQSVYVPPIVTVAPPAPIAITQMVRFLGDYRTIRDFPGGPDTGKIRPNQFGGHLDYVIRERQGDWVKITTQMYGDKWVWVGQDVANITQYFNL